MIRLPSIAIHLLVVLFCAVFLITCKREYSYEGGSGTSVYILKDSTGTCLGSVVMGSYIEKTALSDTNVVQLQINIIATGTYNIQTNSAGGIYFSASGTFTQKGVQTITLMGNGKPSSAGSFTFNVPVSPDCSFTIVINKFVPAVAKFTLAGTPNTCTSFALGGVYEAGRLLTLLNTVDLQVNVTATGAYTLQTDTLNGISFSGSGTFTKTGIQTVTLRGFGTPVFARNLVFSPKADSSTCTFPVTVTDAAPLATYVLESGYGTTGALCIYTLNGTYKTGITLNNNNTLQMNVYVTVVGNFTIATNEVNGITFSYTGTFTVTGAQKVTLKGSGVPTTNGTNTFTPEIVGPHPLGGEYCSFEVTTE